MSHVSLTPPPSCLSALQAVKAPTKKVHLSGLAKIKHDDSVLTTGKEFQKLHGAKAKGEVCVCRERARERAREKGC